MNRSSLRMSATTCSESTLAPFTISVYDADRYGKISAARTTSI